MKDGERRKGEKEDEAAQGEEDPDDGFDLNLLFVLSVMNERRAFPRTLSAIGLAEIQRF